MNAPELGELERSLARAFPELDVAPLRPLDTGFGSVAVETAGGIVFRIARHRGSANGHAAEFRALPKLRARLPAAVPNPEWRLERGHHDFPLGAIGYRKLPGESLSPKLATAGVATDLGRFFAALHAVPLDEAERLGLGAWKQPGEAFEWRRDQVVPVLRGRLTPAEYDRVVRWWEELLADEGLRRFPPALCHGDPWYGNVIVGESGRLAGVIDWEGLEISDPAWDFAAQGYLGERFLDLVVEAYREAGGRADPRLRDRARKLFELREFGGIRLSLAVGDEDELEDAIEKLRHSPVLVGWH